MTLQAAPTFLTFDAPALGADTVEIALPRLRPVPAGPEAHRHDRSCWWDVATCRWAGPAHPEPSIRSGR